MDSWIFQGGYPLVSVQAGDGPGDHQAVPAPLPLCGRSGPGPRAESGARWAVPVNLRASVGGVVQRQRLLVDGTSASIDFDGPVDWVVVNDGAWGFYRVHYDADLFARLTEAGPATVCDPLERMALVVDYWAGVVSGTTDLDDGSAVVESLGDEDDPDVWAAVSGALRLLDLIADRKGRPGRPAGIRATGGRDRPGPAWAGIPRPGESQRTGITRGRVLSTLALLGNDRQPRRRRLARFRGFLADRSGLAAGPADPGRPSWWRPGAARKAGTRSWSSTGRDHPAGQGALPAGAGRQTRTRPAGPHPGPGARGRGPHPGRSLPGRRGHGQPGRRGPGLGLAGGALGPSSGAASRLA